MDAILDNTPRGVAGAMVWGAVALALATLGAEIAADHTRYYKFVDEITELAPWRGKQLQIHGWVGSLVERGTSRSFALHRSGKALHVIERGARSDCLRDDREVVVRARVAHDRDGDYIEATEVKCKCSSNWQATERAPIFY